MEESVVTTPRKCSTGPLPLTSIARPPCGCFLRSGLGHALAWWPSSPQLKHLRLASSSKGWLQSLGACLPPQLAHLASRSPVRGGVDPDLGWNGQHKTSGGMCADGTYHYTCKAYTRRLVGTVVERFSGTLQLMGGLDPGSE